MTSYADISERFFHYLQSDVDTSVGLGLTDKLALLGDPSLAAHQQSVIAAEALLAKVNGAEISAGNFYELLDIDLIKLHLQQDLFFKTLTIDGKPQRRLKPGGVDGISAGIFQLFVNDERSEPERLQDILARVKLAPAYLEQELHVLTQPVKRWLDIEVAQAEGLPELFDNILDWAKSFKFSDMAALQTATTQLKHAIVAYISRLKSLPTTHNFAIGMDKLEQLLALKKIDKTPEQLRQMAADYMCSTATSIETLRQNLVTKYQLDTDTTPAQLHNFLNKRFTVQLKDGELSSVLDIYSAEKSKILDFIQSSNLFPLPFDQDMKILQTPNFLQSVIPAGAMWPPLALREGTQKSLVYLTLKEDELDEHTHLGIPVMMIHEGIPGHHLQFASAALQPSLIRRIFSACEHAEGWTTMLEDYMLDIGYVADNLVDEVRFIAKREISRLVARVGIDLYFMSGDKQFLNVGLELEFNANDPFENAALLLQTATGFTDGRVQAELNWYSTEQGYPLSYLTGNRMVWQLKSDLQTANKKQLSQAELDQEFHRIYLQSGCMPVSLLREVYRHEGLL
tara:strand:+ start:3421 stop:5124 length:1704 start_codon:yes stop_codon:yes gene_type:complete